MHARHEDHHDRGEQEHRKQLTDLDGSEAVGVRLDAGPLATGEGEGEDDEDHRQRRGDQGRRETGASGDHAVRSDSDGWFDAQLVGSQVGSHARSLLEVSGADGSEGRP